MSKQLLIINQDANLIEYAFSKGLHGYRIFELDNPNINEIQNLLVENPNIRHIIASSISNICYHFNDMDKLVGYCLCNNINISVLNPKISLFNDNGTISAEFKARVLIDTDFEHF